MLELIIGLNWGFLIISIFFVALHFLAEPLRWYFYDTRKIDRRLGCYINVFNLSAVLSYFLPAKLGLPSRYFLLRNFSKLETSEIAGRMLLDGIIYYGIWAFSALLSLFLLPINIGLSRNIKVFVILISVLFAVLLSMVGWKTVRHFGKSKINFSKSKMRIFHEINHRLLEQSPKVLVIAVSLVLADIFSQGLRHMAFLEMIGQSYPFNIVFPITAIAIFCGLLSMMPMGLGGYDGSLVLLLGVVGIPLDDSLQVIMINRVMSICVAAVFGLLASRMLHTNLLNLRKEIDCLKSSFKQPN
ncbi:MAG: lysylphosphatidylglycerol synthase domain-containing protein [Candidatus Competibacteraceae bacterium]